jgi:hypothetical protein
MRGVGEKRHALSQRANDLYETPPVAVERLLKVERLPEFIWEPACGPGAIARVLRAAGHRVIATDLVDYKSPDQDQARWDFLAEREVPEGVEAVITNPPFKIAGDFAAHALELCPRVMLLLRLAFLESKGRTEILENGRLARVHVFRKRLPMMHRAGWQGPRTTSTMAFAWFVWQRDHKGPTTLHRL